MRPRLVPAFALMFAVGAVTTSASAQGTIVPEASATPQPVATAPPAAATAPTTQAPAATSPPATTTTTLTTTEGEAAPPTQAPVFVAPPVPAVSPRGQWVYSDSYGWIWVPEGSTSVIVREQPYVYVYTPAYGWTWYGSPWGHGAYYVGPWVHRGYGPVRVWHRGGWYAPRVVVRPRVVASPIYRGAPRGGPHHGGRR